MRQLISKILSDKRVQISIAIALVIAIGLLFYDSPPEDNSVSFSQYREVLEDAKIRPQTTAIPSLSPKEENVSPETRNVEFEEALASARQAHKRCELAFRKLLPNKKIIRFVAFNKNCFSSIFQLV